MSNQLDTLNRTRLPAQHGAKDLGLLGKISSDLGNSAKNAAKDIRSIAKDVDEILQNDLGIHSEDWKKAGEAFVHSAKRVRGLVNKGPLYINDALGTLGDFVASKDNSWEDKCKEIGSFSTGLKKSISDSSNPSVEHEFVKSCEDIIALCKQYRKPPWSANVQSKAKEIKDKCSNLISKTSLVDLAAVAAADTCSSSILRASIGLVSQSTRSEMITFIQENTPRVASCSNPGSPKKKEFNAVNTLICARNMLYEDLNDIATRFNSTENENEMYEHQLLFVLGLYDHFAKILEKFAPECLINVGPVRGRDHMVGSVPKEKKSSQGIFSFFKKFLPFKS
ncbi:hypothetical protein SCHPADRAFT_904172 [Schizopora paradoxa]|uniref:Uncharacterized protein n=1 Tax=Schizopora paradoxa TaxID=27342 RepID=A0A0H2S9D7_9AGAM|nr:hypothetical protein SCHPADRAFT_904172 [Schizopora paradoxa]